MEIGIGICLIIFAGGLVSYIHLRKKREGKGMSPDRARFSLTAIHSKKKG